MKLNVTGICGRFVQFRVDLFISEIELRTRIRICGCGRRTCSQLLKFGTINLVRDQKSSRKTDDTGQCRGQNRIALHSMKVYQMLAGKSESAARGEANDAFQFRLCLFLSRRGNVGKVLCSSPNRWICRSPTRDGIRVSAIDAAGRQAFTMDSLDKNSRDLLRQRPVFRGRPAA